jgi:Fe-Mn family superoxide dismutase
MERTHKEASNVSLYSAASQIWNNDFFLQGLCPEPIPMPDKLARMIEKDFGSVDQFKELFTTYAESMNGSGWLWVVNDSPGPNEKLKIMCTFNTGSPFFQSVVPPTFNVSRKAFMPAATNSSGLFASFSFASPSLGASSSSGTNPAMINNKIDQGDGSKTSECLIPIETRFPGTLKAVPVLGLSLWEHAYILDYGTNKRRYIDHFWRAVNWNRVAIMLNVY